MGGPEVLLPATGKGAEVPGSGVLSSNQGRAGQEGGPPPHLPLGAAPGAAVSPTPEQKADAYQPSPSGLDHALRPLWESCQIAPGLREGTAPHPILTPAAADGCLLGTGACWTGDYPVQPPQGLHVHTGSWVGSGGRSWGGITMVPGGSRRPRGLVKGVMPGLAGPAASPPGPVVACAPPEGSAAPGASTQGGTCAEPTLAGGGRSGSCPTCPGWGAKQDRGKARGRQGWPLGSAQSAGCAVRATG